VEGDRLEEEERGSKELERDEVVDIKGDIDGNDLVTNKSEESSVKELSEVEGTKEGDEISDPGLEYVEEGWNDTEFR